MLILVRQFVQGAASPCLLDASLGVVVETIVPDAARGRGTRAAEEVLSVKKGSEGARSNSVVVHGLLARLRLTGY
jgi:hypothetical protein